MPKFLKHFLIFSIIIFFVFGGFLFLNLPFGVEKVKAATVNIVPNAKHANDTTNDLLGDVTADDAACDPDNLSGVTIGDGCYTVDKGSVMQFTTFDVSGITADSTITAATLHLQFGAEDGYSGTNPINYDNGAGLTTVGITPTDITGWSADQTFNLFAAGIDTITELQNLDTEFTSNDGSGADAIHFDYIYIAVTYTPPNITVGTTGTQTSLMTIPSTDNYVGGAFTFTRNAGSINITQIIISETGTVNATSNLSNAKIYYETAASCSYDGTEALFGTAASFNASQKATITGTMSVGTSQVCGYVVLDVGSGATDGQTLEIEISNPSTEVTAAAGTVSPATAVAISGTTTLRQPPTVTSVSPNNGKLAGGTSVTITGTGFISGATVTFGGSSATGVTVVSSTSITATTPSHSAGAVDVVVTNPDTQSGTLLNGYTYNPFPTVTSVSPNNGKLAGGTSVTVTGTGFISSATVTFGGSSATGVTVVSSTSITATTPSHSAGAVDVVVTNPDTQSGTLLNGYTYNPFPTVTSVSPNTGPTTGGTSVTITGTGFISSATVTFGGSSATGVTVVSSTSITATTPSHSAGAVDVVVTNPDTQSGTLAGGFTYSAGPTVSSVSPNIGPTAGGTGVTVSGANFVSGATITFGGTSATSIVFVNSTTITCNTPSHSAGAVNVVVTNPDTQFGTLTNGFTYADNPVVTSVSPNNGKLAGGTSVTITGANFVSGATVTFGGSSATGVTVVSSTSITATTPSHSAGAVDVVVTNPNTLSGTLSGGYTYNPFPTVTTVDPSSGSTAGGTSITIIGTGFISGAAVTFGGSSATGVTVVNSTTITCNTPAHSAGAVNVVVTNPDTQFGTLTGGFTYVSPPTVTSVSPNNGKLAGGTSVTITGANFQSGATVKFGTTSATSVTIVNSTTITCVSPAHTAGSVDVVVTNPDTQSGSLTDGYTYNPFPTVSLISPSSGPESGDTNVTITGTGFISSATVRFDGSPATNVIVVSSTSITATTPSHAVGVADVVVVNLDTQSGTLSSGFTFVSGPSVTSISPNNGKLAGGTSVTITGANFVSGATVKFGTTSATGVTVVSSTSITATTPSHSAGAVDVVVTNPDTQSGTLTDGYTYNPFPTISSISPSVGALTGGTSVTITGTNFLTGVTVTFGGSSATGVTVVNSTTITCNTPSHSAGAVDVVVTNTDTQSATLAGGFTYTANPAITSISPNNGKLAGGTSVTITGANFVSGATVTFGGSSATGVTVVSSTSITATTPSHAAGSVNVVVTNPDTLSATLVDGYVYNPFPTVSSISPVNGSTAGGTSVTITGTNFLTGVTVTFGGSSATNVTVVSSTSITAIAPLHSAGVVDVVVTNSDTQAATLSGGFTYSVGPSISSVSPSGGSLTGGTSVTITGANFQSGATVKFGTTSATSVTIVNSTTITCVSPAHVAGSVDVVVTNSNGQSGTLVNGFTYAGPPTVNLTASPTTIFEGESSVLNWSSTDASSCAATGSWLGVKSTVGNETVTPSSTSTYTLTCDGVGGSAQSSVTVTVLAPQAPAAAGGAAGVLLRFGGFAYSGQKVTIYNGSVPAVQLVADLTGRFSTLFRIQVQEKYLYSIVASDRNGQTSPFKTFPSEFYARGGLTDILIAPTINLSRRIVAKNGEVNITGYATPRNRVRIEIGDAFKREIRASETGYYSFILNSTGFVEGNYRVRAVQIDSSGRESDFSLFKFFKLGELLPAINSDLNSDGKFNISDWSIFLSAWSTKDQTLKEKGDFNKDGKVNIIDLSIFLKAFSKR